MNVGKVAKVAGGAVLLLTEGVLMGIGITRVVKGVRGGKSVKEIILDIKEPSVIEEAVREAVEDIDE